MIVKKVSHVNKINQRVMIKAIQFNFKMIG